MSKLFGKLDVRRHLSSGAFCAMAGAAIVEPVMPTAADFRNVRRFIYAPPSQSSRRPKLGLTRLAGVQLFSYVTLLRVLDISQPWCPGLYSYCTPFWSRKINF